MASSLCPVAPRRTRSRSEARSPLLTDLGLDPRVLGIQTEGDGQQKRSFFEGKVGQSIGSPLLDVADDPLIPRAFGSRLWDGEGLAARRMPVLEKGVLRNYYLDTYYAKKLQLAPTTGGPSNASWTLGTKSQTQILRDVGEGILVTGFIGGNSNGTTGDYSFGVLGFRIRGGA